MRLPYYLPPHGLNNPVKVIDPSGHCGFEYDENGEEIIDGYDCSPEEFDSWDIETRIKWILLFMSESESDGWFNNILGILEFFDYQDIADSGSWLSQVDSYILHGIQDGYAQSRGKTSSDVANPATEKWETFFNGLYELGFSEDQLLWSWGNAEQTATDFGVSRATAPSTFAERTFLELGDVYRQGIKDQRTSRVLGSYFGGIVMPGTGNFAGFLFGGLFSDPRIMVGGHSPVYYGSNVLWVTFNP